MVLVDTTSARAYDAGTADRAVPSRGVVTMDNAMVNTGGIAWTPETAREYLRGRFQLIERGIAPRWSIADREAVSALILEAPATVDQTGDHFAYPECVADGTHSDDLAHADEIRTGTGRHVAPDPHGQFGPAHNGGSLVDEIDAPVCAIRYDRRDSTTMEDNCGAEYPHHAHLWTRGDEVSISDAPRCPGVPTTRNVAAEHGIVPRAGRLD